MDKVLQNVCLSQKKIYVYGTDHGRFKIDLNSNRLVVLILDY